ncbi:MAG: hypothetical protein ACRYFL_07415 [Janthinobacterium lividum]
MKIFQFNNQIIILSKADVPNWYDASFICKNLALTATFVVDEISTDPAFTQSRSSLKYFLQ